MNDTSIDGVERETKSGFSRRNALKAGVVAGVGVAAWSGASITSLGGTPAYAVSCSQSIFVDLTPGCRNTDSSTTAAFRYHPLKRDALPAGFTLIPTSPVDYPPEGTDCDKVNPLPVINWDHTVYPNLTCTVHLEIYTNGISNCVDRDPNNLLKQATATGASTSSTDGTLTIPMTCQTLTQKPNGGTYSIFIKCATTGAPGNCF